VRASSMTPRPLYVVVIAPCRGKFAAIVHGTREGIEFPAGSVEPGETLERAARRELHEETGLAARYVRRLGTVMSPRGARCAVFVARALSGSLRSSSEGRATLASESWLLSRFATFPSQNAQVLDMLLVHQLSARRSRRTAT
jgi:8-oxo-dGTP pyrophosphatase MutT (NUDIX family)